MGRAIGGAVVGYVVDFVVMLGLMTVAWFALGADGAFRPGVWEVTTLWILLLFVASFASGYVGGTVAVKVAASARGATFLAVLIVALTIVFEFPVVAGWVPMPPLPRPDDLPMFEAMGNGRQPLWSLVLHPLLGAAGALLAGRRRAA
ncbi:MAG: hypothetical protein AB7G12_06045 [Thermoanaerobaculia bacterium]